MRIKVIHFLLWTAQAIFLAHSLLPHQHLDGHNSSCLDSCESISNDTQELKKDDWIWSLENVHFPLHHQHSFELPRQSGNTTLGQSFKHHPIFFYRASFPIILHADQEEDQRPYKSLIFSSSEGFLSSQSFRGPPSA